MSLLNIDHLTVSFGQTKVVQDLSLNLAAGERFALVGESGSGKSVTALTLMRLLQGAQIEGQVEFNGELLLNKTEAQMQQLRGREIAMIFQEPMTALNPLMTIGAQIAEVLQLHEGLSKALAWERAASLLQKMGMSNATQRLRHYPHQLSGGQRQRAMIAMALACKPKLLLADEPTTALDVTVRAQIMALLRELQVEFGIAIILITHDLNLVRNFAQRVGVMEKGRLVEVATASTLFSDPQHAYTKKLLQSIPQRHVDTLARDAPLLLRAENVGVHFPGEKKMQWSRPQTWWQPQPFVAVHEFNLDIRQGETVGIVGESGSGKTTVAMALLGLQRLVRGQVAFMGQSLTQAKKTTRKQLRRQLQIVFQDPFGSLSPRMTIEEIVGEGLALHQADLTKAQRREQIISVLHEVGLSPDVLDRYPHEFSGGQRQRIAIARVLILRPKLLVLDEPTSALDVSIQQQVLTLLSGLQKKYNLAYLLISHDLAVIQAMAHRVLVLKEGQVVEQGEAEALMNHPVHPYTRALLDAAQIVRA